MEKCCRCNIKFNVSEARSEYNSHFDGDADYDDEFGGEVCAECAISDSESNMNLGRAIDMMNGDEDYDDDFVDKWL